MSSNPAARLSINPSVDEQCNLLADQVLALAKDLENKAREFQKLPTPVTTGALHEFKNNLSSAATLLSVLTQNAGRVHRRAQQEPSR